MPRLRRLLNFWTETGLIGLVGFLWTSVQVLRSAVEGLGGDSWARTLSIGLLASVVPLWWRRAMPNRGHFLG